MKDETVEDWLRDLAARTPTPGGGAVAALAAATSAALISMVTNYTTGPKWAEVEDQMKQINKQADALRLQGLSLSDADARAFAKVGAAYKLPSESIDDRAEKAEAIQTALIGAAEPPRKVAELAQKLVKLAEELIETSNPNVISDVAVAASMANSALESAIVNIEINQHLIKNEAVKDNLQQSIELAEESMKLADNVTKQVRRKIRHGK